MTRILSPMVIVNPNARAEVRVGAPKARTQLDIAENADPVAKVIRLAQVVV